MLDVSTWSDATSKTTSWKIISVIKQAAESSTIYVLNDVIAAELKAFTNDASAPGNYLGFFSGYAPTIPLNRPLLNVSLHNNPLPNSTTQQTLWGCFDSFPNSDDVSIVLLIINVPPNFVNL